MGFSSHIVDLIKSLFTDEGASVRTTHRLTVDFRIEQEAQQGCILSSQLLSLSCSVPTLLCMVPV